MKRVRQIYVGRFGRLNLQPLDSDDPRLHDLGTIGAAMVLGNRVAKRLRGPLAFCLDIQSGEYHRARPNQRMGHRKAQAVTGLGWTDWHCLIGSPAGCGLLEIEEITIQIRVNRARGKREYYYD